MSSLWALWHNVFKTTGQNIQYICKTLKDYINPAVKRKHDEDDDDDIGMDCSVGSPLGRASQNSTKRIPVPNGYQGMPSTSKGQSSMIAGSRGYRSRFTQMKDDQQMTGEPIKKLKTGHNSEASDKNVGYDFTSYTPQASINLNFPQKSPQKSPQGGSVESVGMKKEIEAYSMEQWRGGTAMATKMIEGYRCVANDYKRRLIQVIRGDNYCAIRSSIVQILLMRKRPVLPKLTELNLNQLQQFCVRSDSGLHDWSFAGRLQGKNKLEVIKECLHAFYTIYNDSSSCEWILDYLNQKEQNDIQIMESVKILMMLQAINLHRRVHLNDPSLPAFCWLLFARDTALTLKDFFKNHIDVVGNSGGLEQIDMYLLAHTFGLTIRTFRIKQYGKSDFVTYYNDAMEFTRKGTVIDIITEDDRHYNIVT